MSRFADPSAIGRVDLGACQCPGTPHPDGDTAVYRTDLSASAVGRIGMAGLRGAVARDPLASHRALVLEATLSWNLLWPDPTVEVVDGEERPTVPVPLTEGAIEELDEDTLRTLAKAIDANLRNRAPKGSGGRSPAGSPARKSRTRR